MDNLSFNIFGQLNNELQEFLIGFVHIAGLQKSDEVKYLGSQTKGYEFSQWQTLNLIELYYNSKFETGIKDSEGQRKMFLNICKFRADVAAKQTDLDVKDFVFIPEEFESSWGAYFLTRKFKQWAKVNYFGKLINEVNKDFSKFGSAVIKRCGKRLERVPLMTLRNSQDAKSLKKAGFVIEEHLPMTKSEMAQYKEWDLTNVKLPFGKKTAVFERYGEVPRQWYNAQKKIVDTSVDEDETINCMAILIRSSQKKDQPEGNILFLEEVKPEDRPYEEAHWDNVDGRWLGRGEIENQFENQILKNTNINLRKRNLFWASKKVFQSKDTESLLAKNLVRDIRDGDILKISPNGEVTQINQQTQAMPDFQAMDNELDKNSDQLSFTYEAATGEAMPSGTPFRLGVLLSNAVQSHFDLKKENLGLFFESVVYELLFPVFKKENKDEHIITLTTSEEGVQELRAEWTDILVSQEVKRILFTGSYPDVAQIRQHIEGEIAKRKNMFIQVPEAFYNDLKVSTQLVITGEQVNLPKRLETLTTLYQAMVKVQDPRAEKVLEKILTLSGENYDMLVGPKPPAPPMQQVPQQAMPPTGVPANVSQGTPQLA